MKKIIFVSAIASLSLLNVYAETTRERIVEDLIRQNSTLNSKEMENYAEEIEERSTITLKDPNVEFGYQWNAIEEGSDKRTLSVSQEFDLSVISGRKRMVVDRQVKVRSCEYDILKIEEKEQLLLLCDQIVYLNRKNSLLAKVKENYERSVYLMSKAFEKGECSKLDYNRTRLAYVEVQSASENCVLDLNNAYIQLEKLNDGVPVDTIGLDYDLRALPVDFEQWYSTVKGSLPIDKLTEELKEAGKAMSQEAKSQWWPKITLSYNSEMSDVDKLHGGSIGLNLPLWENRKVKNATKARVDAMELQALVKQTRTKTDLKMKYENAEKSYKVFRRYEETLADVAGYDNILKRAFEIGELSLFNYLLEMNDYLDLLLKVCESEYQYQCAKTTFLVNVLDD